MKKQMKEQLFQYADKDYQTFSQALIPGGKPLIGVRLPQLRKLAKDIVRDKNVDERAILADPEEDQYMEEIMLRGMLIGYGSSKSGDIDEALKMLDEFVPMVDSWSVCDSCCVSFTLFQKHREQVYQHIQKYLFSNKEFEVRVGLILLLDHFLKCDEKGEKLPRRRSIECSDILGEEGHEREPEEGLYIDRILDVLNRPYPQGYYAQMAAAWLTAECFVTFPEKTWDFLKDNQMDLFTYSKSLQKICESRIPSDEVKKLIRAKKRKA